MLLLLAALVIGANAQTRLPKAVYSLDFEGAETVSDFGGTQHGDGSIVKSEDEHFGTYYQNNPNWTDYASRTNYLEVTTDAVTKVYDKDTKSLSVGFWVNATVGNQKGFNNYWGAFFNMYNEAGCAGATWPCSFEVRYAGQIHGNAFGVWYDNNHNDGTSADGTVQYSQETMEAIMKWSAQTTKLDEETGTEVPDYDAFADNWHYITTVYTNINTPSMNFKFYIDGVLKIDANETFGGEANLWEVMSGLDRFCIGGNSFNWADPDNAYAYDDVAIYADALSEDQIKLIMDLKMGNLTDDVKLVLAQSQLEDIMDEANDYANTLAEAGLQTLSDNLSDHVMDLDPYNFTTVDAVNAEINNIQAMIDADKLVLAALGVAKANIEYYTSYANSTNYDAIDEFSTAIAAATDGLTDVETVEAIDAVMDVLEKAKITYIFSQTGDVIDVTRVIDNPWFVNEEYEPNVSDGEIVFDNIDESTQNLNLGKWAMPVPEALKGASDFALYFTNGRTTANLFHSSTVADAVLDVQQTITDLPAGYYELSTDMCSTSEATDNHIYATSGEFTIVSPTVTGLPTPFNTADKSVSEQAKDWITLTTNKVYVGEDGTLTIGARSTTDGTAYKGWFCATNFQLKYYGTEYDMSDDVVAKQSDVEALISELDWKGDIANANSGLNAIINSDEDSYNKLSMLTELENSINIWIAEEEAFATDKNLLAIYEEESDATAKAIYNAAYNYVVAELASETMTVDDIEALTALYPKYLQLANTAISAEEWGTAAATSAAESVISDITGKEGDAEFIASETEKLISIMKSSITEFEASEESPKNITALVGNASFDQDLHDAWTIEGTYAVQQGEIEFFNNSFNLSQVITNLPKGTYKVTASGFYRDGGDYRAIVDNYWTPATEDAEDETSVYDTHANMELYATVGTSTAKTAFVSIASDSVSYSAEEDDTYYDYYGNANHVSQFYTTNDKEAEPVVYYPYWMWDAYDMITNRGKYADNEVYFVIPEEEGDVIIGATKATTITNDWCIADNFQLFYLGQEIPDAIEEIAQETTEGAEAVAYYTTTGTQVQKPLKGIYIVKYANGKFAKKYFK